MKGNVTTENWTWKEGNIKMGKKQTVWNKTSYSRGSSLVLLVDSSEYEN
jgi:hypothetical protein